jgi:inorganic pyrophosphatase
MAEFKQQEIKVVKEGDPINIDRAAIRYSVRTIHNIVRNLDAMIELEDRKNPDLKMVLMPKEEDEIYSLFDEVSKLSKYLVYHGLWKENYNGLCLGMKWKNE